MNKKKYSDKEITIFDGVINLIKEGNNLYTIKVADIAKISDVGKGTIYDYFESKEQAISKALMYYMDKEMEISYNRIMGKESFRDKYYEILFIIKDSYRSNMFIINTILSSAGFKDFYKHLADEGCNTSYFFEDINNTIKHLLEIGKKDGIVKTDEEDYYLLMAVRGAISTFSHYIGKKEHYRSIDIEEAMDTSYKILLKSLK
ncbi:MAG: TetR family transcriptional regulator [Tissierella sp.]|uniref:TetR family transcriptional regulator n=1 Tax=Tissierella sp. TaxID=41274 RepID=UPI003F982377